MYLKQHPTSILKNIGSLLAYFSLKRKKQILLLFVLQLLSAFSEVFSIGALIPFLTAITNIEQVTSNHYFKIFLEALNVTEETHVIIIMASIFVCAILVANILRFLTLRYLLTLTAKMGTDLGTYMFRQTLHKPYTFFTRHNSSHIISAITTDLGNSLNCIYNTFLIITQLIITAAITITLVTYHPTIALIMGLLITLSYALIMIFVSKTLRNNSTIRSDSYREMIRALQEGIGGIRHLIVDAQQNSFVKQYNTPDRTYRLSMAQNSVIGQAPRFLMESIGVILVAALVIYFASNDNIANIIPMLGFLGLASFRLLPAIQQLYSSCSTILGLETSLARAVKMLDTEPTAGARQIKSKSVHFEKELRVQDMSFSYDEGDDKNYALSNINIAIPANQAVAFVGHTGSGKTTMTDLILGLLSPQKGKILVDGNEINKQNMSSWQKKLSHVPQQVFLTDASIYENIAFGVPREDIDTQRVISAAQKAQIHDFIESLPNGYNQVVGERGVQMSGGQRQRIGIARALYKKASLIIFDEATSALDSNTEKQVIKAIEVLKDEATLIFIAHRLSTIKYADNIFVFSDGKCVANGNYETLKSTSKDFQTLLNSDEMKSD